MGLKLNIPPTLSVKIPPQGVTKNPHTFLFLDPDHGSVYFSIEIIDMSEPRSASNFFDNPETFRSSRDDALLDKRFYQIVTSGRTWDSYYYIGSGGATEPLRFVSKEKNLIAIVTVNYESLDNIALEKIRKLLSNFRFVQ